MPPNTHLLPTCALLEQKYASLLAKRLIWRSPAYRAANRNEPVLRQYTYSPGATNLRSSAFICGSFFAGALDSKNSDRINRMDRINPSVNPVNPVNPVLSGISLCAAPDINYFAFINCLEK